MDRDIWIAILTYTDTRNITARHCKADLGHQIQPLFLPVILSRECFT